MEGVSLDANDGFRLISNAGEHGVQEVPHLHVHILGGRHMGRMVQKTI
jgi:histidine triad (HIT) family protein